MKQLLRFIVGLLAPFILIFGGGGLIGVGIEYEFEIVAWAGLAASVCGLLWGCWLLFMDGAGAWWD